jgi:hypothetical protein
MENLKLTANIFIKYINLPLKYKKFLNFINLPNLIIIYGRIFGKYHKTED